MEIPTLGEVKVEMVAWATPRARWFNYFPGRFNERKARQLQALVDELEFQGVKVGEHCANPFITSVKIMEVRDGAEGEVK